VHDGDAAKQLSAFITDVGAGVESTRVERAGDEDFLGNERDRFAVPAGQVEGELVAELKHFLIRDSSLRKLVDDDGVLAGVAVLPAFIVLPDIMGNWVEALEDSMGLARAGGAIVPGTLGKLGAVLAAERKVLDLGKGTAVLVVYLGILKHDRINADGAGEDLILEGN